MTRRILATLLSLVGSLIVFVCLSQPGTSQAATAWAWTADLTADRCVDQPDLAIVRGSFNNGRTGDINADDKTDLRDVALLSKQWTTNCTSQVEAKISELKTFFDTKLAGEISRLNDTADNGLGPDYYELELSLHPIIAMYEATGDLTYLNMALGWMETEVSTARVLPGCPGESLGYKEWPRTATSCSNVVDDIQVALPMAHVARLILTNPTLAAQREDVSHDTYGTRATALRDFVDVNLLKKRLIDGNFAPCNYANGWVWSLERYRADPVAYEANCPGLGGTVGSWQTMTSILARSALDLYLAGITAERNPQTHETWKDFARQAAIVFRDRPGQTNRLVLQANGSYVWDKGFMLFADQDTAQVWDVWHANKDVPFFLEVYKSGPTVFGSTIFTSTFMQRISRTFTENIWNGVTRTTNITDPYNGGAPYFRNYIDGSDTGVQHPPHYYPGTDSQGNPLPGATVNGTYGMIYEGWCYLGMVDPQAQQAGEALFKNFVDYPANSNVTLRTNTTPYSTGRFALPACLAYNLRFKTY